MNTSKHTPGPWAMKDNDTVIGPNGNVVAECCGYSIKATDKDQQRQGGREANAHLIAAAPAMYKALIECEVLLEEYPLIKRMVKQALAQAEGK